jgi:hypothetical protein
MEFSEYIVISFNVFLQGVRDGTGENWRCHTTLTLLHAPSSVLNRQKVINVDYYLHVCISPDGSR